MDSARLFIAAPAPPELSKHVLKKNKLEAYDGLKRVRPDQLHITLKFLGPTPIQEIPLIIESLNDAASAVEPFSALATTVRAMPERRPSVIAASVEEGGINELHHAIEDVLLEDELTQPETRSFKPHVTVVRVKRGVAIPPELQESIIGSDLSFSWEIDHFVLFESTLTKDGPEYSILQTFTLPYADN